MTFIAGPYTATMNHALGGAGSLPLGTIEDGFELEEIKYAEPIKGDNLGDSTQDYVDRGKDVFINFVLEEVDLPGVYRTLNQNVNISSLGAMGAFGQVGVLYSNLAGILTLTAVAGTTASAFPATLTANKAIVVPNFAMKRALASRLRKIPMRLQLLPYVISSTTYNYVMA